MDAAKAVQAVNELLQCSVCTNLYRPSGVRAPKVLPCQHTFCVGCLKSIRNEEGISCPICRECCNTEVDQLANNLTLLRLTDIAGVAETSESDDQMSMEDINGILMSDRHHEKDTVIDALCSLHGIIKRDELYNEDHLELLLRFLSHQRSADDSSVSQVKIATECIRELQIADGNKGVESMKMSVEMMTKTVAAIEIIMDDFGENETILLHCLSFICFGNVPTRAKFDRYAMAKRLMSCVSCNHDHQLIDPLCVIILSQFVRDLTKEEHVLLGSVSNIKVLFDLVKILHGEGMDEFRTGALNSIIFTLTNMTDETPSISLNVVDNGGIEILTEISKGVQACIFGFKSSTICLMANIADVPALRHHFLTKGGVIVKEIQKHLNSDDMQVSFFAGQIISNLGMLKNEEWKRLTSKRWLRKKMMDDLYKRVASWENPTEEFVCFLTFRTLYPFLQKSESPGIQLYAAWTMLKLCLLDATKYMGMINKEGGRDYLLGVLASPKLDGKVKETVQDILLIIQK